MSVHLLLPLTLALLPAAGRQAGDETRESALAAVKKLGGKVERDGNGPLAQVVGFNLDSTPVTDGDLARLNSFPQLRVLSLNQTAVSDAGLGHLKGLTRLRTLSLIRTKDPKQGRISDAGLESLKGLTRLETLNLGGAQITDAGLAHLEGLDRLRELFLFRTRITG